jgi:aspartyl/asparaginyl beta-hydroxylase (cupin superfamily)
MSWSNALNYMPEPVTRAPHMQPWLEQARAAIRENQEQLHAQLHARMQPLMGNRERRELQRFEHCLDIVTGRRPFVTARPLMLPFPRLPAIPFFERDDYPWVAEVEAAFPAMLEELHAVLASQQAFEPYVKTTPGEPPAQFAALDHNLDWGAYFLWKDGQRIDAHADRCPRTEAALALAPQNTVPGRAPVAFYSALKPGTHIPPHNGATNTRLTVHMPLVIPPDCALRVGDETRAWEPGKLLMFDDTIRHEAWNYSDQLRVVLIFDVWHPMLTELERELVSQTVQGMLAYYGSDADLGEL